MSAASSGLGVSWHEFPQFRMSSVWSAAWKMFRQDFRLFVSIIIVETALIIPSDWALLHALLDSGRALRISAVSLSIIWMILIGMLGQALVALFVFQKFHRQPATINSTLQRVASRIVPLVLTIFALAAISAVGLLALLIPGLIMMTVYSVAIAACAVQGTGPGESLSQSAALTRFHRWPIFGLAVEFSIISAVLDQVVQMVWIRALGQSATSLSLIVISELVTVVPLAFFSVAWAMVYCHLRAIKDGEFAPLAP